MMKKIVTSGAIGISLTVSMVVLSYFADVAGASTLAKVLLWPNTLLQLFALLHNIGTAERPIYEGTPINFIAFLASLPIAVLIYGIAAHFFLGYGKHRT